MAILIQYLQHCLINFLKKQDQHVSFSTIDVSLQHEAEASSWPALNKQAGLLPCFKSLDMLLIQAPRESAS